MDEKIEVLEKNGRTNLLQETEQALKNHHLAFRNVKYILNKEGNIPVADFVREAQKINYNDGYGKVIIDPTLKIVGAYWWFERGNYDGNEGWIYYKKPSMPRLPAINFRLLETRHLGEDDLLTKLEKEEEKKK